MQELLMLGAAIGAVVMFSDKKTESVDTTQDMETTETEFGLSDLGPHNANRRIGESQPSNSVVQKGGSTFNGVQYAF